MVALEIEGRERMPKDSRTWVPDTIAPQLHRSCDVCDSHHLMPQLNIVSPKTTAKIA